MPPGLVFAEADLPAPETVFAVWEGKDWTCSAEWLILWKSQPVKEATWEFATNICAEFPSFSLEGKANSVGQGSDRNHSSMWNKPVQLYSRRPKHKKQDWLLVVFLFRGIFFKSLVSKWGVFGGWLILWEGSGLVIFSLCKNFGIILGSVSGYLEQRDSSLAWGRALLLETYLLVPQFCYFYSLTAGTSDRHHAP